MTRLLIWLTILLLEVRCRRENNTLELSCNITTIVPSETETHISTTPILAVNRCPEGYKNEEIIKKCEYLIDSKTPGSQTLFKPVINIVKNRTYWNEDCAACNNETDSSLESWSCWQEYNLNYMCMIHDLAAVSGPRLAEHTVEFNRNYFKEKISLRSTFNKSGYQLRCFVKDDWPMNLVNFVAPCIADNFRNDLNTRLESCQYIKKDVTICVEMLFMVEGLDFVYDISHRITLISNSSAVNYTMKDEFIAHKRGIDSMIFMCEPDVMTYGIAYWSKMVRMIVSVIFITIYLTISLNQKYFQSFPNKILFSYSIGLLIMYLGLVLVHLIFYESCMDFFLVHFSWFFHFFWTLLLSLELCRLTYCSLRKRFVSTSSQHKRFLVYCFVGFVLPAVLPTVYFSLLLYDNGCPGIPGYFVVPCRAIRDSTAEYVMNKALIIYHRTFFYLIPTLFLIQAFVLIYMTKGGPNRVRSTANRSNTIILMKMAYVMGTHWMLYEICVVMDDYAPVVRRLMEVSQYCTDLQGVFVFFAFGFERRMLTRAWEMCSDGRRKTKVVQSGTDVTELNSSSRPLSEQKPCG